MAYNQLRSVIQKQIELITQFGALHGPKSTPPNAVGHGQEGGQPQEQEEDPEEEDDPVRSLISEGRLNEAFFLARRRAAEGQEGAEQLLSEISRLM